MTARRKPRDCVIGFYSGNVVWDQLVEPPIPITTISPGGFASALSFARLTAISGIAAPVLDPVTTTPADVQTHSDQAFDDPVGPFVYIPCSLRTRAASTLHYSFTTSVVDLSSRDWHGLPASGSAGLYRIAALAGTIPKRTPVCIDLPKTKIKKGASILTCSFRSD
jgi:hypothetical protein